MGLDCVSSVTISQSGKLSGTATIKDGTKTVATIDASGLPEQGGDSMEAGTNNGWTLTVDWNSDGTANGTAAGDYQGSSQSTNVPVLVDHGGPGRRGRKRSPRKSAGRKARTARKSQARSKKSTGSRARKSRGRRR